MRIEVSLILELHTHSNRAIIRNSLFRSQWKLVNVTTPLAQVLIFFSLNIFEKQGQISFTEHSQTDLKKNWLTYDIMTILGYFKMIQNIGEPMT